LQLEKLTLELHEKLKKEGVDPDALAVLRVMDQEMLIGEVGDHEHFLDANGGHGPFMGTRQEIHVCLKNPKLIIRRVLSQQSTGALAIQTVFSDYDLLDEGYIEVVPKTFFFLDWLNYQSQINYCGAYFNFLEGRRLARAQAAGIQIAGPEALRELPKVGRG
jgi:hypothetical protein